MKIFRDGWGGEKQKFLQIAFVKVIDVRESQFHKMQNDIIEKLKNFFVRM